MAETLSAQMMSKEIAEAVEIEHEHPKTPPLHMTSKLSDEDEASIEATINVTVGEIMKIEDAALTEAALNEFVEEMMALEGGDSSVMDAEFTGDVPTHVQGHQLCVHIHNLGVHTRRGTNETNRVMMIQLGGTNAVKKKESHPATDKILIYPN